MRFTYDNSAANPSNPHRPPQRVRAGPRSTDEMGQLWLEVVPRRAEDAAVLNADFVRRMVLANVAGAELNVRADPRVAAAHNQLAIAYLQAGRVADAQAQLEEALRLDPRDAEAHSNLGTVLQAQGRIAEGCSTCARPCGWSRRTIACASIWATACSRPGRPTRRCASSGARSAQSRERRRPLQPGDDPRAANRLDEAIAHLQRVVEIDPRNGDAYRNLALAYALQRKIDQAIPAAQAAVRLQPDSAAARDQLQRLLAGTPGDRRVARGWRGQGR